jgi:hypothetical protein
VVQVGFEIGTAFLGNLLVGRVGTLALAAARLWIVPLEHQVLTVREPLRPNSDSLLWHGVLGAHCHGQ